MWAFFIELLRQGNKARSLLALDVVSGSKPSSLARASVEQTASWPYESTSLCEISVASKSNQRRDC